MRLERLLSGTFLFLLKHEERYSCRHRTPFYTHPHPDTHTNTRSPDPYVGIQPLIIPACSHDHALTNHTAPKQAFHPRLLDSPARCTGLVLHLLLSNGQHGPAFRRSVWNKQSRGVDDLNPLRNWNQGLDRTSARLIDLTVCFARIMRLALGWLGGVRESREVFFLRWMSIESYR